MVAVVFSPRLLHVPSPGAEGTEEGTQAVGREKTGGTRTSCLHAGPPDRVRRLPSSVASAPRRRPCRSRRQKTTAPVAGEPQLRALRGSRSDALATGRRRARSKRDSVAEEPFGPGPAMTVALMRRRVQAAGNWIPACAGMTEETSVNHRLSQPMRRRNRKIGAVALSESAADARSEPKVGPPVSRRVAPAGERRSRCRALAQRRPPRFLFVRSPFHHEVDRVAGELGAVLQAQLGLDLFAVGLHRLDTQLQPLGDFAARKPAAQELEHF